MRKLSLLLILLALLALSACNGDEDIKMYLNPGIDTIEINQTFIDTGAYLKVGDTNYSYDEKTGTVDHLTLGTYTITYSATYKNQFYQITREVIVVDQMAPVISLNAGVDTVVLGSEWVDAGVSVLDNSNEIIIASVSGSVDVNTVGTYEIEYQAEDSSGNITTVIRYVHVIE